MYKKIIILLFSFLISSISIVSVVADAPYADDMWYVGDRSVATKSECETLTGESYNNVHAESSNGVTTNNGTILLNFRAGSFGDGANKRSFFVRSFDNGATWTDPEIFVMGHDSYSLISYGGLSVKCVYANDTIYGFCMFAAINQPISQSHCYLIYSKDNGDSWVGLNDSYYINDSALNLTSFFADHITGQWNIHGGIELSSGRVIVAAYTDEGNENIFTAYTDDIGNFSSDDWVFTGSIGSGQEFSENMIVELNNGSIYRTIRGDGSPNNRHYSFSHDYGDNWLLNGQQGANFFPYHPDMVDPESWASIARLTSTSDGYDKNRIIIVWNNATSRIDLSVGISYNECETDGYNSGFNVTKELEDPEDGHQYPYLLIAPNKTIILTHRYDGGYSGKTDIEIVQFNVEWISDGMDTVIAPQDNEIEFISICGQTNGTTIYLNKPTINWTVVTNASMYWLQIDNNNDFSSPEINYTDINEYNYPVNCDINTTRVSFTLPDSLPSYDRYYMRVRAYTR